MSSTGWSNHEAEGKLEDPFSADIEDSLLKQSITIFHVFTLFIREKMQEEFPPGAPRLVKQRYSEFATR